MSCRNQTTTRGENSRANQDANEEANPTLRQPVEEANPALNLIARVLEQQKRLLAYMNRGGRNAVGRGSVGTSEAVVTLEQFKKLGPPFSKERRTFFRLGDRRRSIGERDDNLEMLYNQKRSFSTRLTPSSRSGSNNESISLFLKQKPMGPPHLYCNTPLRQTKLGKTDAIKKELRDRVCKSFARWMYDAGISFNVVKYPSFNTFYEAIGQYGLGVKPSSYHEVRVSLLKKEVELTLNAMKEHKTELRTYGCSTLSDG
ncbi:hypothetical protein Dsin_018412 [Dipteronia sinensis]|uniref:Uncharacterized protein n=1 Tax=Dipteronia sinensis TaxID=43782 RepID=A0AAE0A5F7_9ROSI|nr:hypothetical protein Dsin_018412 [Dipteronia sinensis]